MGLVLADDVLGRGLQRIQGEVDALFDALLAAALVDGDANIAQRRRRSAHPTEIGQVVRDLLSQQQ